MNIGVWNYQILLLVHGQVNDPNPLVLSRFTCPKTDIFFSFLEYPKHMFSLKNKKNNIS